jgi:hypothetical protein
MKLNEILIRAKSFQLDVRDPLITFQMALNYHLELIFSRQSNTPNTEKSDSNPVDTTAKNGGSSKQQKKTGDGKSDSNPMDTTAKNGGSSKQQKKTGDGKSDSNPMDTTAKNGGSSKQQKKTGDGKSDSNPLDTTAKNWGSSKQQKKTGDGKSDSNPLDTMPFEVIGVIYPKNPTKKGNSEIVRGTKTESKDSVMKTTKSIEPGGPYHNRTYEHTIIKNDGVKPTVAEMDERATRAESVCRDYGKNEINEPEMTLTNYHCCTEHHEAMNLTKCGNMGPFSYWLDEVLKMKPMDHDILAAGKTFAGVLEFIRESCFPKIDTSMIKIYFKDETTMAFNKGGELFFNLWFWAELECRSSDLKSVYFWFHVFCHEVAHNDVKDHGVRHNFILQWICSRHISSLYQAWKSCPFKEECFQVVDDTWKAHSYRRSRESNMNSHGIERHSKKAPSRTVPSLKYWDYCDTSDEEEDGTRVYIRSLNIRSGDSRSCRSSGSASRKVSTHDGMIPVLSKSIPAEQFRSTQTTQSPSKSVKSADTSNEEEYCCLDGEIMLFESQPSPTSEGKMPSSNSEPNEFDDADNRPHLKNDRSDDKEDCADTLCTLEQRFPQETSTAKKKKKSFLSQAIAKVWGKKNTFK